MPTVGQDAGPVVFEPQEEPTGRGPLNVALLVTPAVAGLLWLASYLYADALKERQHYFMSDGWGLAPLGAVFMAVCGTVLAFQVVFLLRALPDSQAGRWVEAALTVSFATAVALTFFGSLGLSTVGDLPDGFPSDAVCVAGLVTGALVTVAVPTSVCAWLVVRHPPQGEPLRGLAWTRLTVAVVATILLVVLPTAAEMTATPGLLLGLLAIPALDIVASRMGWTR